MAVYDNFLSAINGNDSSDTNQFGYQPFDISNGNMPVTDPISAPDNTRGSRLSIGQLLGHLADGFAIMGGATPMYQNTVNQLQDREQAQADHLRGVNMDMLTQALAQQKFNTGNNNLLAQGMRGLQAIQQGGGDPNAAWPVLAQQLGIDEGHAQQIGQAIQQNPGLIDSFVKSFADPDSTAGKLGMNPVFATNPQTGEVKAYQLGPDGTPHEVKFAPGFSPASGVTAVNTGDTQTIIDKRTGRPVRIMPVSGGLEKGERPVVNSQGQIIGAEAIPGSAQEQKQTQQTQKLSQAQQDRLDGMRSVLTNLDVLQRGFDKLHQNNALPGEGNILSQVSGALARTKVGTNIGEQFGNANAQQRLGMAKNVSALQQELLKALPASATRTKFEQEVLARGLPDPSKMDYNTATQLIGQYRTMIADRLRRESQATAAPARSSAPSRPVLRPRSTPGKPTVSNWN